jgi:glycosyltransferase involved in cell wall biosynthesis
LQDRVVFAGAIGGDELINLYAGALAVVYAPFDEDYGYVTLESFLCAKPGDHRDRLRRDAGVRRQR